MNTATLSPVSLSGFQNPFRLAQARKDLVTLSEASNALNRVRAALPEKARDSLTGDKGQRAATEHVLAHAQLAAQYAVSTEKAKPVAVRACKSESHGQDDAWRVWAVLSRDLSARLLAFAADCTLPYDSDTDTEVSLDDALDRLAADLWAQWGFDPAPSPLSDYSPTGRMFQRSLFVRVSSGHVVLSQSGARDV